MDSVYCVYVRKLNHFHTSCLHRLLKVQLQDEVPDASSVHTLLQKVNVRWIRHIARMPDKCISKRLMYG
uniref:Uncharacterized protein n=1 Tax=Arion vulgaris TaxID=1028688 RepID=A0A0B6Z7T4_9EUPU